MKNHGKKKKGKSKPSTKKNQKEKQIVGYNNNDDNGETIRNHQQANKCFACRSTTMHMATKENKNEERRKTDDGDEEQQHNERTEGPNKHPTDGRRPLVAASVPPFPPWDPYLFCNSPT
jgi:hypothetical protein